MNNTNKKITIADVLDCPNCGSPNTYEYSTDEIEFSFDGTGQYNTDCRCKDCGISFRTYINFSYNITSFSKRP